MDSSERRVEIEHTGRVLDDFFKVEEAFFRYERFDGRMSHTVRRLNFERGDAVAAILVDRKAGDVILVEQFRYPTHDKGPGWLVEAVAGIVPDGADPEATIRREVLEEAGYHLEDVEHIGTFFLSPGGSSERIILFYAEVNAADRTERGGGIEAEGEDIRLVRLPLGDVAGALRSRRFSDAKTIIGLMWLLLEGRAPAGDG